MRIIEKPQQLADCRGFSMVPTMGALHEGHASLLRAASLTGRPVLLTIFVNPTQFGPAEDFTRYPRTLNADLALAQESGVEAVYLPTVEDIYPRGLEAARAEAQEVNLPLVATAPRLEDAWRPTHFGGVAQVVARLFDLCRPRCAVFGEKDFQQLLLIEQMVQESPARWPGLEIIRSKTVREDDGLALSSRNRYLSNAQRTQAVAISQALSAARAHLARAADVAAALEGAEVKMRELIAESGLELQYAVIRDARTLLSSANRRDNLRALIAAQIGTVRLIDNMEVWTTDRCD